MVFPPPRRRISTSFSRRSRRAGGSGEAHADRAISAGPPERGALRHAAEPAAGKLCDDHLLRRQCVRVYRCLRQEDRSALSICAGSGREVSRRGNRSFERPQLSDRGNATRVASAPVLFDWFAQIAQEGDKVDDPSTPWPEDRQLVKLGTLTITGMAADQPGLDKSLLFLPNNVPDGMSRSIRWSMCGAPPIRFPSANASNGRIREPNCGVGASRPGLISQGCAV